MKRILYIIYLLFFFVSAYAQNYSGHLKFIDIPINGSITQFQKKLISKGFSYNKTKSATVPKGQRVFDGKIFGTNFVFLVHFNAKTNIVYQVEGITDYSHSEDESRKIYNEIKTYLSRKKYKSSESYKNGMPSVTFSAFKNLNLYNKNEKATEDNLSKYYNGFIELFFDEYRDNNYNIILNFVDFQNARKNGF